MMIGDAVFPPLTLGTVQLGMDYGTVVRSKQPDRSRAIDVLDAAWAAGVTAVDTARAYGRSESVVGAWLARTGNRPRIVSKFPSVSEQAESDAFTQIKTHLDASLTALGVDTLDVYLAHDPANVTNPAVLNALAAMRDRGHIDRFGVSVYTVDEARAALTFPEIGAIQLPISLFDRRFLQAGIIGAAAARGIWIFARSVFLQGVMLCSPDRLTGNLGPAAPTLDALARYCTASGCSRVEAALDAVLGTDGVTSLVIGVNRPEQIREITTAMQTHHERPGALPELMALGRQFPAPLLDPRVWAP